MFEIGNSLHEARVRQGIGLQTAELATKIRGKYLKALEEEQFELLPAQTYVKGFLRSYAEFLGLDGQLYVDEYNSRFVVGDDDRSLRPRRSSARPERRTRRLESNVVLVTLAAIAVVAALVIVAWNSGDSKRVQTPPAATVATKPAAKPHRAARPTVARLVVTARRGNSLLEVHVGSATGKLLFQGTLLQGKSVPLGGKRLWIDVGVPENLDARLNGRRVKLGAGGRPEVVLVTAKGVQPLSTG